MPNKGKKHDRQFKAHENNGEHRNGRLSQFKNKNSQGHGTNNEYIDQEEL